MGGFEPSGDMDELRKSDGSVRWVAQYTSRASFFSRESRPALVISHNKWNECTTLLVNLSWSHL